MRTMGSRSRSAQGLLQNVQRKDKEVNVRRENTRCQPRASGKPQRALGESLNMTPESDIVQTLHWEEERAGRMVVLQAGKQAPYLSDAHGYQVALSQCCQDTLLPTDYLKQ